MGDQGQCAFISENKIFCTFLIHGWLRANPEVNTPYIYYVKCKIKRNSYIFQDDNHSVKMT